MRDLREQTALNHIKALDDEIRRYKSAQKKYANDSNTYNRLFAKFVPLAIAQTQIEKRMWQLEFIRGRKQGR